MIAAELLTHLRGKGISVEVSDGRLKVSAPKGVVDDDLRERIRANRDELLAILEVGTRPLPLVPISRDGSLPLSRFQRRLWIMSKLLGPTDPAYGLATVWPIASTSDPELLAAAIQDLTRRHAILRTIYPDESGEPTCRILAENAIRLERLELAADTVDAWRKLVDQLLADMIAVPFDLERDPAFRWKIVVNPAGLLVIVASHHIGVDQWSFTLLRQELDRSIAALSEGRLVPSPPLQYVDFADWQRRRESQATMAGHVDWWAAKLENLPDLCIFPPDLAKDEQQSWRTLDFEWDEDLSGQLRRLAREHGVTPYMVLLGVCATTLRLHTGQTDIVLGSPTGNRELPELETMIGPFVNVLALRLDLEDDPSFATLLARARESVLDAYAHADAPFEAIVERLNPSRSFDHMPLFQVAVVLHNATEDASPGIQGGGAMYDMTWFARESGGRMTMGIEYRADLYSRDYVVNIVSHFEAVLREASLEPAKCVSTIPLASQDEVLRLVSALQPAAEATLPVSFPLAFVEQVRRAPSRTAVRHSGHCVSYGELDACANRIARLLFSRGVRPGGRVGVCMDRTPTMLAALIGTQKLGAAYVPLDPGFPVNRLAFMVEDSGVRTVLTDATTEGLAQSFSGAVLTLDETALEGSDASPVACHAEPAEAAYVIYTSGSTGRPNGVVVPHRALSNFLDSMLREPGLKESDVVAAITTISFDIAALELLAPLLAGAQIELIGRTAAMDGAALADELHRSEATLLQATPATWRLLIDSGWKGDGRLRALSGGESLPIDLAEALLETASELWNLYGPTETTVWSSAGRIRSGEPLHIGRPIANTQIYIVNEHGALVPPGIAGEILIGGKGVALGYHARPELNAARFVTRSFADGTLYRTGDLGMWADGKLRHLGRLDHQVKVRGYRIELGEIEASLMANRAVQQAVVVADGKGAATRLVAYCVLRNGALLTASEIRAHLRLTLPDYMIPSIIEFLGAIPRTPNGKIDRKSLPSLTAHRSAQRIDYVPCKPGLETELAEIWKEILSIDRVGANDNFFEIGGHSLLSLRVAKATAQRTGRHMEPRMLFTQSLRNIAGALARDGGEKRIET